MTSPHGQLPTPFSETTRQPAPVGAVSAQRTAYARRPSSTVLEEMEDTPAAQGPPPLSAYQPPPFTRSDVSDWRRRQHGEPPTQTSRPETGEVGVAGRTDGPRHSLHAGELSAHSMHPRPFSTSNGEVGAAGRTDGPRHTAGCMHPAATPLTLSLTPATTVMPESQHHGETRTLTSSLTPATTVMLESQHPGETRTLTSSMTSATTAMLESQHHEETSTLTSSMTSATTEPPVSADSQHHSNPQPVTLLRQALSAVYQPPPSTVPENQRPNSVS